MLTCNAAKLRLPRASAQETIFISIETFFPLTAASLLLNSMTIRTVFRRGVIPIAIASLLLLPLQLISSFCPARLLLLIGVISKYSLLCPSSEG